ncbi:hypothetical protein F3Y30_14670 [Sinorhizobium sp. BG8]|nr:hypothetical protein F3Y30_14670 [Sinorhizobium sp. BG8]
MTSLPWQLGCSIAWGALMVFSALASLYLRNGLQTFHLAALMLVFFGGGALAWPVVVLLARKLVRYRRLETRFAACFVLLSIGTIGMTALLFALNYRYFYAQWHEPFGTRIWLYQFIATSLGAAYQFAVMGMSLYLPVGLPILAAASLWLAKAMR